MRLFLLSVLVALVAADVSELVGHGYDYSRPSGHHGGMESHHSSHHGGHGGHGGFHGGHGADGGYHGGYHGGHGSDGGYHGGHGGDGGFHGGYGGDGGFVGGPDGAGDFGAEIGGLGGELDFDMRPAGGMPGDQEVSVSKRYFTVTAMDDNADDDDQDESTTTGGGHKSYDVVFANNPASGSLKSALRAVSRFAGDHQTAVYVLSQQLGVKQLGAAFRAAGIKPSKPNVHFVKYRTPEEAARAQQQIRAQYDRLGGSSEDGGHETSPVHSTGYRRPGSSYASRGGNYGGSPSGLGSFGGHTNRYGTGSAGLGGGRYGSSPSGSGFFGGHRQNYGSGPSGGYRNYGSYNQGHSGLSNQYLPPRYGGHSSGMPSRGLSNQYLPPRY